MFMIRSVLILFAATVVMLASLPAQAQNQFRTVVVVNEDVVTAFDVAQRVNLLRLISPANATRSRAQEELVNERLQMQAARRAGLLPTTADIDAGIAELGGRANLTPEQFLSLTAEANVSPEALRDFVGAGVAWRDLVRARFGSRARITDAEIDRALAATRSSGGVRVLLSEIIMPADPDTIDDVLNRAERIAQVSSFGEFSELARRFSATPTRDRGGRLDWTTLAELPGPLRPIILGLAPGEVTDPIELPNAVALFQLRAIQETEIRAPSVAAVDYARYLIPGGQSEAARAEAARLRRAVDVCDDLYAVALGQPPERLLRDVQAPAEVPNDVAAELALLDVNEISTALTTPQGDLVFLMLCARAAVSDDEVDRSAVANQLRSQRLAKLADTYLEQLRAEARIREK